MAIPDDFNPARITLAVLAGGEGSRMGRPKGELRLSGRPILDYLVDRFGWPGPTLLVTAPGRQHPPGADRFDREVTDPVAGQGPLRGVLTALESATTELVVITTVDMPGIDGDHLRWIAERAGPLGAMTCRDADGRRQLEPFPSVFRASAIDTVRRRLADGRRSVVGLSGEPGFSIIPAPTGWPASTWVNLNSPADLAAFTAVLPYPHGPSPV